MNVLYILVQEPVEITHEPQRIQQQPFQIHVRVGLTELIDNKKHDLRFRVLGTNDLNQLG